MGICTADREQKASKRTERSLESPQDTIKESDCFKSELKETDSQSDDGETLLFKTDEPEDHKIDPTNNLRMYKAKKIAERVLK